MPSHIPTKRLLHIPFAYVQAFTFTIPFVSLFSVVSLGVYLHLDKVTTTHCKVNNLYPIMWGMCVELWVRGEEYKVFYVSWFFALSGFIGNRS